jgi:hypothetical protein
MYATVITPNGRIATLWVASEAEAKTFGDVSSIELCNN